MKKTQLWEKEWNPMHESHLSTLFVFNQPKKCFHKGRLNIWLILDFFMVDQIKKDKFIELTQKAIKKYRENLLDISNRNKNKCNEIKIRKRLIILAPFVVIFKVVVNPKLFVHR